MGTRTATNEESVTVLANVSIDPQFHQITMAADFQLINTMNLKKAINCINYI